ncbi:MAG: tRNA (N6-isopentenyl adenosine(37)-C2)-methylthiotransferase MiaB [Nitrospinae bacterium]|nr:tRNA (N6-isopentenyl adenosine(37)-C2)-methylthiotransferase MiaB [Nitrospinota bacterium]
MPNKNLALLTYGCQMNEYDSEKIGGILQGEGYQLTDNLEEAQLILVNTCCIREKAEQKFYSQLGRLAGLKKKNPSLAIGVGGCIAQREGKRIFERAPQVDLVFGTQNISRLPELLRQLRQGKGKVADVAQVKGEFVSPHIRRESTVKAWVTIMQGCNNFCSFCVVPYTRGPERSVPGEMILDEIRGLARQGYKEVTLLGQNVNAYGKDLVDEGAFPGLLSRVDDLDGIERIRFTTSHPKDLSEELMGAMARLAKVCEHIHLPVQAGSDSVLDRMNRRYTAGEYRAKIARLRALLPSIGISTDVIVGFPGESQEDYARTRELIEEVEYDSLFLFKYSARPETVAATLSDQVPEEVKQERFEEILALQKGITLRKNQELEGKRVEVLVEGASKKDPAKLTGRTRTHKIVNFRGPEGLVGHLVELEVIQGKLYSLEGRLALKEPR